MAIALMSLALVVLLFVFFSGEDDDASEGAVVERRLGEQRSQGNTAYRSSGAATAAGQPVPLIEIVDGSPLGGPAELGYEQGEGIRFVVGGKPADRVRVHGYGISARLAPGRPTEFNFLASIAGAFEVELERGGAPIAELRVER